MESCESDSTALSISNESLLRSTSDHSNHDPQLDALFLEFQKKLALKDNTEKIEETVNKDCEFNASEEVLCDEHVVAVEEYNEEEGWGECDDDNWDENESNNNDNDDCSTNGSENDFDEEGGIGITVTVSDHEYPLRSEAEDCAFYMRTGTCKYGLYCKFNHPLNVNRTNNNLVDKEKEGDREESADRLAQIICKYYQSSGGCRYGKACRYDHSRGKCSEAPVIELNFLGLPVRLGEKECPYYMRTGSCKFGTNCKFNHPDPTVVGGGDLPATNGNGGSISLQKISRPCALSWSSLRTSKETAAFMPKMSPTQDVSPRNSEWNMYQAPLYLPEGSMRPPSSYGMNNPALEKNIYMHNQKKIHAEEFPERPGEPECSYFMKTGNCKYRSNCKFHHVRDGITKLPSAICTLSDKGLPLRPDQNVCTHYSRYGICKFGPACRFDHPLNQSPFIGHMLDQQSPFSNSAGVELAENGGVTGQIMQ